VERNKQKQRTAIISMKFPFDLCRSAFPLSHSISNFLFLNFLNSSYVLVNISHSLIYLC